MKNVWKVVKNVVMVFVVIMVLGLVMERIENYYLERESRIVRETETEMFERAINFQEKPEIEMKKQFLKGCLYIPGLEDYCECAWSRLLNEYGTKGIVRIGFDFLKTDEMPDDLEEKLEGCLKFL